MNIKGSLGERVYEVTFERKKIMWNETNKKYQVLTQRIK